MVGRPVAAVLALPACSLLVPEHVQLVSWGQLRGEAEIRVVPRPVAEGLARGVRFVSPGVRVSRVLVEVDVGDVLRVPLRAGAQEEPQSVLPNRPAERATVVVVLDQRRGRRQSGVLQFLRIIAALQRFWTDAGIQAAGDLVAT